ncbi:MAG: prefoldin subunit [Infirmifilum sp.]|jgi:prefoldin beta subunit|nr:prefoldin subunit [Infirmifilum uzonense]
MSVDQSLLIKYQQTVDELRAVVLNLQQYRARLLEIEKTLKELEKTPDQFVYKAMGGILMKTPKDEILKDLSSEKELLQVRIEEFSKREKMLRERASSLEKQLKSTLTSPGGTAQ